MSTVSDSDMATYLAAFAATFAETADRFIPQDKISSLQRYPHLSEPMVGYVSTQFGAGFEYMESAEAAVVVRRGRARIEHLLLGAPPRIQRLPPAFEVSYPNVAIVGPRFEDCVPVRLCTTDTHVRLIRVSVDALGWSRAIRFAELFGDNSPELWSEAKAVERAKDEIFSALIDIQQAASYSLSLKEYLRTLKDKLVLVLGDYSADGEVRLREIK